MDINVYCYACGSSLEVVEEYNEGYPFHGVTVKVNPCSDCAAQQPLAVDVANAFCNCVAPHFDIVESCSECGKPPRH